MQEQALNMRINLVWARCNMLYSRIAAQSGLGYPEFMVLYGIRAFGYRSQKEIAENCGLVKQTVNSVIRDLRARGMLELIPSERDRRARIIALTDTGKSYVTEKIGPVLETEREIYHRIGDDRVAEAAETLDLFNVLLEKKINDEV